MMSPEKITSVLKVVTVEDSLIVAKRLESMLFDVTNLEFLGNAPGIPEALEIIGSKRPDVTILDLHLGRDANGMELLPILKREYPLMKIIILTNLAYPSYQSTCLSLGADYFFDKSNDFDKLPEVLKGFQL
jgi:DNA-binding NarL/FixJ family response regulator